MKDTKTFLCLGTCQDPAIPHESVVKVEVGAFSLEPGDIAVFSSRGHYACHRILYKKRFEDLYWYYLSPDHGPPDGWIPAYRMEGRVLEVNGRPLQDDGKEWLRLYRGRVRHFLYAHFWSRGWGKAVVHFLTRPLFQSA